MALLTYLKTNVQRLLSKKKTKKSPKPIIKIEDLQYIWNYQMVVIPNTSVIDLSEPLLDLGINLKKDLEDNVHKFPFIVGDNGTLIPPNFGRRVTYNDKQKTSIYLEYPLNPQDRTKIILRIIGNDPQSITIVLDERKSVFSPLVMFLWKPRNQ